MSKGYDIPRHAKDPERMHMSDLFDMITGTSIGAIQAAGYSIPSETNRTAPAYFADDILSIMTTEAQAFYVKNQMSIWVKIQTYVFYLVVVTSLFHLYGRFTYDNPRMIKEQIEQLEFFKLAIRKKIRLEGRRKE